MRQLEKVSYVLKESPTLSRLLFASLIKRNYDEIVEFTSAYVTPRPLNPKEAEYFKKIIDSRGLSPWALPLSFFRLPSKLERKIFKGLALEHHHMARAKLVSETLPAGSEILDIGGAVDIHPEGALLALGYPHKPERVYIVDRPDDERTHLKSSVSLKDLTFDKTEVRYVYSGMQDLSMFEENQFDLVWSGQSIEHISIDDARKVLSEVRRVLKPGGLFCLDTPNRNITRLMSDGFIHPEHQVEYFADDLAGMLQSSGFEIDSIKAVTPLPRSLAIGRVSKLEILNEAIVNDNYKSGFSFFIQCKKSASLRSQ